METHYLYSCFQVFFSILFTIQEPKVAAAVSASSKWNLVQLYTFHHFLNRPINAFLLESLRLSELETGREEFEKVHWPHQSLD
mmetsp:Transcript_13845/g.18184  ORF Transcript_13845/g.18184 Transcript_13845/m.18184 type:complete len:83 (+) Transcript_13845:352-600(+)